MSKSSVIKVEHLSKYYKLQRSLKDDFGNEINGHWAIKDVSFEINTGESIGIIGSNGSGKSTLLKILAGVTKPTSGKVTIRGKVASILDVGAGFHPELSGRENIFLNGQIHGFSKKEIASKYDEIIDFSGIEKFIEEPVKNYSNGMFLRLAFSIIAHLDFDVYLFDEVLSVGDESFIRKCQNRINYLKEKNKCFVIVSHNEREFIHVNRIFQVSNEGKWIEQEISRYVDSINKLLFVDKKQFSYESKNLVFNDFKVYVGDEKKNIKHIFKSDESISLIIDLIDIKQELMIGIVVNDRFNHAVIDMTPSVSGIEILPGFSQKLVTQFEKKWFNAGFFTIDIVFFSGNKVVYSEDNVASFKVELEDSSKGKIHEHTWGALRPSLIWKSDVLK